MPLGKIKEVAEGVHVWITLVISAAALIALLGFSISPPWAKAETVTEIQTQVSTLLERQRKTDRLSLKTQRLVLMAQLREAEADLKRNPDNYSAQQLVTQLKDQIAEIDEALRKGS